MPIGMPYPKGAMAVRKAKPKSGAKKAHPGFKAVQDQIAQRQGISRERAGAILASASRKASPAAKKANPRLLNVRGTMRGR